MPLLEVDTPALIVDLDAFEANVAAMAKQTAAAGVALRPHAKTHKCVEIARCQLAAGAKGLCCQKVSEAEAMLASGVADLLVSNQIVGLTKLRRLAQLARKARVTTCAAFPAQVEGLSAAAAAADATIDVLVEIDVGDGRMGLADPDAAVALARKIAGSPKLRFRGLQAYSGPQQHTRAFAQRKAQAERAAGIAADVRAALERAGLPCEVVTGGGTGSFAFDLSGGVFNEVQAGSYVFMDLDYERNEGADGGPYRPFRQSLFLLASVMSGPFDGWVYVDAGTKAVNIDCGFPEVSSRPDLTFVRASDEHGRIESRGGTLPALGDKILLVPSHCDPTVNLHDWLVAVRAGTVEAVWRVDARGHVF